MRRGLSAIFTITLIACGSSSTPGTTTRSSSSPDTSDASVAFPDPACVGLDDLSNGTPCTSEAAVCTFDVPGGLCHPGEQFTSPYSSTGTCTCTSAKWSCTYAPDGPRGFGLVPCPDAGAPDAGQ